MIKTYYWCWNFTIWSDSSFPCFLFCHTDLSYSNCCILYPVCVFSNCFNKRISQSNLILACTTKCAWQYAIQTAFRRSCKLHPLLTAAPFQKRKDRLLISEPGGVQLSGRVGARSKSILLWIIALWNHFKHTAWILWTTVTCSELCEHVWQCGDNSVVDYCLCHFVWMFLVICIFLLFAFCLSLLFVVVFHFSFV